MPKIIAKAIAAAISGLRSEAEIRSAIALGIQTAESAGYEPGSENSSGKFARNFGNWPAASRMNRYMVG